MLEDNKKIYEQCADSFLPNWQDMNKNDLVRSYCNTDNPVKRDAYMSAIMLKYWNKIDSYSYKCRFATTPEDVHTWLVNAILYAANHQPWNNPDSSIYNDSNGPDKVINRVMESRRITFYQQLNRNNRKINSAVSSLDKLIEEFKDVFLPQTDDEYTFIYNELVRDFFVKKDYFMAFLLDALLYERLLQWDRLDPRRIMSYLRHIDATQCKIFSHRYNLDYDKVVDSLTYVCNLNSYNMKTKLEYNLLRLKRIITKEMK